MRIPSIEDVRAALGTVQDPEIRRPITELGMVEDVAVAADGTVRVDVLLTVSHCPLSDTIERDVHAAVAAVPGVAGVDVAIGVMSPEQRERLVSSLRGARREIPFNRPGSTTRVIAVASGKGGVGKSSVTVNLAAALAAAGRRVGVFDADVHGFSVPPLLGVTDRPTQIDRNLILPPVAHDVKVMSIGVLVDPHQAVIWRGPKLHRVVEQFATDVFWGDLDFLLIDLPPGTGDVAISVGQVLPGAEVLVVTTPQAGAADVAERAGLLARATKQGVLGVVENMSWLTAPDGSRMELFGSGGGARVAESLTEALGTEVPLLAQVPLDPGLREAGDQGMPIVLSRPESEAAVALRDLATRLDRRPRGLAGRRLPLSVS